MRETTALDTIDPMDAQMAAPGMALTPMQMAYQLAARGADAAAIREMLSVGREIERDQARREFDAALSEAKAEIPPIRKNRQVGFESRKPGSARTDYRHEDLAEIARTVDPILGKHGLSYRFRTTAQPNEPISVTCIVSHRLGHSEENTLSAGRDDSGNKNSIQQIGSTITYLQRYTLKAALGLAASNDDDGAQADAGDAITDEQRDSILALAAEVGADIPKFCAYFKVESVADLPASLFARAVRSLETKRAPK